MKPAASTGRLALFLPSLEGGGAERVMVNLAAGLVGRGFETDLVLARAVGPFLADVPPSVRVVELNGSVLRSLPALAAYLRRERPVALIAAIDHANVVAMAAGRITGARTRTLISIQCTLSPVIAMSPGIRMRTLPILLGRLHRWADAIIAVSDGVAEDTASVTGIPRDRIEVIYNPVITPALFRAAAERPPHAWFADNGGPIVLGVGRLVPQKNFRLLIGAFAAVKRTHDARLVILGEGPERPVLEALVQQLTLQDAVSLPGFVNNPYACMARARVHVLSSEFEGLPTALIESLALGTPVVATDCRSGPREILRDGELGDLVPTGDVRALGQAIQRAVTAPHASPSAELLRPYTLDVAVDRFLKACRVDAPGHR
jgi:glycosyltransferase involved in cell wall biosynthesis